MGRPMQAIPKAVIAIAASLVLGTLAWVALTHAWADLRAAQAHVPLWAFIKGTRTLTAEEWALAEERLQQALALDPGNPSIMEDLGLLEMNRALAARPRAAAGLERAVDYLRRSLRARPASPYAWGNLALAKSWLGALDAEFLHAIERAATLGAWEPEVQLTLDNIGFRTWDRLPPASRETIRQTMRRSLKRQEQVLFDMAAFFGRMDVLCATPEIQRAKLAKRCG